MHCHLDRIELNAILITWNHRPVNVRRMKMHFPTDKLLQLDSMNEPAETVDDTAVVFLKNRVILLTVGHLHEICL